MPIIKTNIIALAIQIKIIINKKKNLKKGSKSTHSFYRNEQSKGSKSSRGKGCIGQSSSAKSRPATYITVDIIMKKGH